MPEMREHIRKVSALRSIAVPLDAGPMGPSVLCNDAQLGSASPEQLHSTTSMLVSSSRQDSLGANLLPRGVFRLLQPGALLDRNAPWLLLSVFVLCGVDAVCSLLWGSTHYGAIAVRVLFSMDILFFSLVVWTRMKTSVLRMLIFRARVVYFVGAICISRLLQLPMAYGQPGWEFYSFTLLTISGVVCFTFKLAL